MGSGSRCFNRSRSAKGGRTRVQAAASWLNQIGLYFSILQRKVLTPNDLYSLDELIQCIHAFGERYSALDKPFAWTFTRHDLERRLRDPLLQLDSPALLRIAA